MRPFRLVAYGEEHPFSRVLYVERVVHPIEDFLLGHAALNAIPEHRVSFPVAIFEVVSGVVSELEPELKRRRFESGELVVEYGHLSRCLLESVPLGLDLSRGLSPVGKQGVLWPDECEGLAGRNRGVDGRQDQWVQKASLFRLR